MKSGSNAPDDTEGSQIEMRERIGGEVSLVAVYNCYLEVLVLPPLRSVHRARAGVCRASKTMSVKTQTVRAHKGPSPTTRPYEVNPDRESTMMLLLILSLISNDPVETTRMPSR